jgi:hypothetical protein
VAFSAAPRVGPIAPVGMLTNYLKADQIILLRQKKGGLISYT